jgi:hypothetical protein
VSAADDLHAKILALRPQVPSDLGPEETAYRLGYTAGKLEALREAEPGQARASGVENGPRAPGSQEHGPDPVSHDRFLVARSRRC